MNTKILGSIARSSLFAFLSMAPGAMAAPVTCSLSVGIVPRIAASYRTWANPFETDVLEREKGYRVCQDQKTAPVETDEPTGPKCLKSEFHLEIRYRADLTTRNVRLSQEGRVLFSRDYPNTPASQRILRTIPTCERLAEIARTRKPAK